MPCSHSCAHSQYAIPADKSATPCPIRPILLTLSLVSVNQGKSRVALVPRLCNPWCCRRNRAEHFRPSLDNLSQPLQCFGAISPTIAVLMSAS
jgi:hypothetical protein